MVAKTYLVCQATYLMGSLPVHEKILENLNETIIGYINGRERKIAKDRWFFEREMGGYGMFDLKKINLCIKASWIKRWMSNTYGKDYAEIRLINGSKNADNINTRDLNTERYRSSGEILKKWIEYKVMFFRTGRNMLGARMFFNEMYKVDGNIVMTRIFSGVRERDNEQNLKNLIVNDFLIHGTTIKDKQGMEMVLGFNINIVEFFRLRTVLQDLKNCVEWRGKNTKTLTHLIKRRIKGSKGLRMGISGNETTLYFENNVCELPFVQNKKENLLEEIDRKTVENIFDIWGKIFLKPDFKNFSFRYVQGRLFLNQSVSQYDERVEPYCTFCKINKIAELRVTGILPGSPIFDENLRNVPHESVQHIFWQCPNVGHITNWVKTKLELEELTQTEFLLGKKAESMVSTEKLNIILMWVKYWIYTRKTMYKIPRVRDIENDWVEIADQVNKVKRFRWG